MSHLRPCSGCSRHVRANVTVCPFCDAALTLEPAPPAIAHERLGRAARMALGGAAAMAISVAACEKPKENIAMPYGAPPNPQLVDGASAVPTADPASTGLDATAPVAAVDAAAPASADAGKAGVDAGKPKPPPTATATATAVRQPPPNHNKPYGAPPADGYGFFDV